MDAKGKEQDPQYKTIKAKLKELRRLGVNS
jgi:hypothetical protein